MDNLAATIDSVAAGDAMESEVQDHETILTAEMLGGTVLHLPNGQAINVVQMTGSLEDTINVVQVETTELGDHLESMEEICEIDIDSEEQNHILSETGAHVVVKTSSEEQPAQPPTEKRSVVLPTIPFSFPGQTFDTKCQKLILNVWDFFRRLKKNPDLLDEIRTPQERAAAALHISAATIGKIGKNFKRTGNLETPGKKRNRAKPVVDSVTPDQEHVIRNIIKEFRDSRVTPTLPLVLNECRERINFQGGATSFRRILQRMGYKGLSHKLTSSSLKLKSVSSLASSSRGSSNRGVLNRAHSSNKHARFSIDADLMKSLRKEKEPTYISIPLTTSPVPPSPTPSRKFSSKSLSSSNSRRTISLPAKSESFSIPKQKNNSNLIGESKVLQFEGKPFTISSQALSSLASRGTEAPQTIHVLQPDNTVQQIQIVYATMVEK